jgi:DNA-binding beta-propeller fold protein YncE
MLLRSTSLLPILIPLMLLACKGDPTPPKSPPPPPLAATAQAAAPLGPPASADSAVRAPRRPAAASHQELSFVALALPGATGPVTLDYIAYDPTRRRVWVPVGDTGSVDVFDIANAAFARVDGFKTAAREVRGKKRMLGPSAVAIGDGFAYVGDRASSEVCPVDLATLALGKCMRLSSPTDGVAFVASAHEVWVTTPHDRSIAVLDASKPGSLSPKTSVRFDGSPEGFAVDPVRGVFFTNLEDQNKTVLVDIGTHQPKASFGLDCGADGPRGVAVDARRDFVFVACTDHVVILDAGHAGAKLGTIDTGAGVDNIDWLEGKELLYVAAAKAAKLTVARVDDRGQGAVVATGASAQGARNAVADADGNAYVADPGGARILSFALGNSALVSPAKE